MEGEQFLEGEVSAVIGRMPFLWLAVEDEPGPDSLRAMIERNAIALLSNFGKETINPPSQSWLGRFSDREKVRGSGLWNQDHVDDCYDPIFLSIFAGLIGQMEETR